MGDSGTLGPPCKSLTALAEGLQVHRLVGCRAVYHSLQDALHQGRLVSRANPEVLSRQVAQPVAVLTGELHQEGGAAGGGKKKPLVTPPGFPPVFPDGWASFPRKWALFHFPAQFGEHGQGWVASVPWSWVPKRAWGSPGLGILCGERVGSPFLTELNHTLCLKKATPHPGDLWALRQTLPCPQDKSGSY